MSVHNIWCKCKSMKALLKGNITFSYCLIWKHVAVQTDWVLCSMFPHSELHVRGLHTDPPSLLFTSCHSFLVSPLSPAMCFHLLHLLHLPLVQLHIVFLVFQRGGSVAPSCWSQLCFPSSPNTRPRRCLADDCLLCTNRPLLTFLHLCLFLSLCSLALARPF